MNIIYSTKVGMKKNMLIDYKNCIVNLACSILKYYGAEIKHNTLKEIDNLLEDNYKNVVVLLNFEVIRTSHYIYEVKPSTLATLNLLVSLYLLITYFKRGE